jgi:glucose-1-phosphate cytidylyltransferase
MKVVLFCGGFGLRMREASESVPKPMVTIAQRPILWHIMKYYAHFGHKDFILCLGHKAEVIKQFFLTYNEALANDFVLSGGGTHLEVLRSDIAEWRITFVDTGLHSTIGQRLRAVAPHLRGEEMFLATYGDAVTDAPLPDVIDRVRRSGKTAGLVCVRPRNYSFHTVDLDAEDRVQGIFDVTQANLWLNGGFFVFRQRIFDYIRDGEELVEEPFRRLIAEGELLAYRYGGFFAPMDTLKDKHNLEALADQGRPPWAVWDGVPTPPGDT